MIDYFNQNIAQFWIGAGFIMMAAEIFVLGFGTLIFLFAGIAAIITGLLINFSLLPNTWIASIACFGPLTGAMTLLLWEPFKKMQASRPPKPGHSSDFIGHRFFLSGDISPTQAGSYHYSGIKWRVLIDAESDDKTLSTGERVAVSAIDVGVFYVTKASDQP